MTYDPAALSFVSASVTPLSHIPGTVTWAYSNLLPLQSQNINIELQIFPPPVINLGDTIVFVADITGAGTDLTPADNNFVLQQVVGGSYDPNDKNCLNGPTVTIGELNEYLYYLIRFQNLGNDTAFNVKVLDTLANTLRASDLQLISASHAYNTSLKGNVLEYEFPDILLPPAVHNEPASHGYFLFKIKPSQSLVPGDEIVNSAAIYFDYNPPVITNNSITKVIEPTASTVNILEFSGRITGAVNQLNWSVEFNEPAIFTGLYKSIDNINFSELKREWLLPFSSGSGHSYSDNMPGAGRTYYRLVVKNSEGRVLAERTIIIETPSKEIAITGVISSNNFIQALISSEKQGNFEVGVISADGKILFVNKHFLEKGANTIQIPFDRYSSGVYSLVVFTREKRKYSRLFVWKGK